MFPELKKSFMHPFNFVCYIYKELNLHREVTWFSLMLSQWWFGIRSQSTNRYSLMLNTCQVLFGMANTCHQFRILLKEVCGLLSWAALPRSYSACLLYWPQVRQCVLIFWSELLTSFYLIEDQLSDWLPLGGSRGCTIASLASFLALSFCPLP